MSSLIPCLVSTEQYDCHHYYVGISPGDAAAFPPLPTESECEIPNFEELDPFKPLTKFSMLLISLALGLVEVADVVLSRAAAEGDF